MYTDIYSLIIGEETAYKQEIPISENYSWCMYDHIQQAISYKNSVYLEEKDENKPFKNIVRPLLNLQYRAEGFDVKDIQLFVNDPKNYYKSFLVKKYYEPWARENKMDTFIDNVVESYVDKGGVLVKINKNHPEVVPLERIAFCDQTDMLGGPIAEKHNYSPEQLELEGKRKWDNIPQLIALAQTEKSIPSKSRKAKTPGKYIEVYEVHGLFPRHWLYDTDAKGNYAGNYFDPTKAENDLVRQLHICAFYKNKDNQKNGITLYKGIEKESPYKVLLRDEIYGRALGLGGVEEVSQPQVWVNYDEIHKKNMLDAASKVALQTTDPAFANRNKIQDMENLEITVVAPNSRIEQINTTPVNLTLFENSTNEWEAHARQMAGATESILGESPSAGTPFKLQELVTQEAHSLHEYRKGKIATFFDEIHKDWIIPRISEEISNGVQFLSELDLDELQAVAEGLVTCRANDLIKEKILNGETIDPQEIDSYKQQVREEFLKGGNKKFIEILKDEMKDAPIDVYVNIAGKQKDLYKITDKLSNIFKQIFSTYNPQTGAFAIFEDPRMAKIFNQILEASGLSPIDYYSKPKPQSVPMAIPQPI